MTEKKKKLKSVSCLSALSRSLNFKFNGTLAGKKNKIKEQGRSKNAASAARRNVSTNIFTTNKDEMRGGGGEGGRGAVAAAARRSTIYNATNITRVLSGTTRRKYIVYRYYTVIMYNRMRTRVPH